MHSNSQETSISPALATSLSLITAEPTCLLYTTTHVPAANYGYPSSAQP